MLMQGKTNLQQELERWDRSPRRFKRDYTDGKRTGPPMTIKLQDRHSPNFLGGNTEAQAHCSCCFTHKHS